MAVTAAETTILLVAAQIRAIWRFSMGILARYLQLPPYSLRITLACTSRRSHVQRPSHLLLRVLRNPQQILLPRLSLPVKHKQGLHLQYLRLLLRHQQYLHLLFFPFLPLSMRLQQLLRHPALTVGQQRES